MRVSFSIFGDVGGIALNPSASADTENVVLVIARVLCSMEGRGSSNWVSGLSEGDLGGTKLSIGSRSRDVLAGGSACPPIIPTKQNMSSWVTRQLLETDLRFHPR